MLNPYKIIDESDATITYQYNSLYSWILLSTLVVFLASIYTNYFWMQAISVVLIILYFVAKLIIGREVASKVRKALKAGSVELSGGKYSFSNPLKVKIPKDA